MEIFPLIFGATFGIGIVAGLLHLVIGLGRPRSAVHLTFALVALGFGAQALSVHAMMQTTDLAPYVALFKYGYGGANLFAMGALIWFVAFYTRVRPTRFLLTLSLSLGLVIFPLHLLLPTGILNDISAIRIVTLPRGEQFSLHFGTVSAWRPIVLLWLLLTDGFFVFALAQQWRRGEQRRAILLGLPLILFSLVTTVHGRLVDAALIESPYLGAAAFVMVAIPLSLDLAQEAVRTRRALLESEQQLRAFVTRTEEGIWTVDFERPLPLDLPPAQQVEHVRRYARHFSRSNDAMARILGYGSREDLIGRDLFDVFSPSLPENAGLLEGVVAAGFRVSGLVSPALDLEGRVKYLEGSLTPILGDGHVIRVWGASRDVTERLQMTEELRQHREELAELVATRTTELELANEQLSREVAERQQAQRVLQEREALLSQVLDLLPVGVWLTDATGQIVAGNPAGLEIWGGARYVGPEQFGEYKAWWADTGKPIAPEEWAAARAISRGETSIGELIEIEAFDATRKFILNSAVPLRGEEQEISGTIIVNEDITAQRRAEVELEQRVQEMSALHEIAGTLATLSDLLHALQRVAETVTALFQVDSTHILFSQSANGDLTFVGFARERGLLAPAPLGLTLSELPLTRGVLQEQRTFTFTADRPLETTPAAAAFLQAHHIESFMLVPLVAAGTTVGVMAVNSSQMDRAFSPEEVRLAETVAADIAAAVANLHLLERMQETAALEERQRIASELHDSVTQTIYSVGIMAQTVPRLIQEQKLADAEQAAGQMRLATVGALAQMRTLLFELRPAALAEASLAGLLQQLSDVLTGQQRVPVDLVVSGDVQPPADVKIAFYRIAQEAFNNIVKHAEATRVTVTLRGSNSAVELRVVDNGQGFDTKVDPTGRMGLRIMKERAEAIGARLCIESQPGEGTEITLSWEVKRDS